MFSLQHYEGDERIKKFIFDLISPSEDGKEKDYKNHMGLLFLSNLFLLEEIQSFKINLSLFEHVC